MGCGGSVGAPYLVMALGWGAQQAGARGVGGSVICKAIVLLVCAVWNVVLFTGSAT